MQIEEPYDDVINQISGLLSNYDADQKIRILLQLLDEYKPGTSDALKAFQNIKEIEEKARSSGSKEAKIARRTIYASSLSEDMRITTVRNNIFM